MKSIFAATLVALMVAVYAGVAHTADAPAPEVPAAASQPTPSKSTPDGPVPPPATLSVFNRPIVVFRQSLFGVPPYERAAFANERIHRILDRGGPGTVAVHAIDLGRTITIDSALAFTILKDDVSGLSGESLDTATVAATVQLELAIAETRELRDTRLMVRALVFSLIATAIYALVLYVLVRIGRRLMLWALRATQATSAKLRVGGGELVNRHRVLHIVHFALQAGGWLLFLLVTYEWLSFVLGRFPYTRAWSEQLHGFMFRTVTDILVAVAQATPGIIIALIVFVLARALDRAMRNFFGGVESGRIRVNWVDKDTAPPTRRLVTLAIWVFAVVMAYPYIPGSSTDAFKGLSVLIGLMISVGASGIVGQAASGLILMYTRTFRPGEFVRIGDAEGTVVRMGMFTTGIRTGMGEELSLPNATVLSSVTHNLSRPALGSGFMVTAHVTIGYDAPWRQVEAMLLGAAKATEGVFTHPPPRVYVAALSDFYVEYRLVCQVTGVDPQQRAATVSALNTKILDAFNENGVQIMSPHYLGDPKDAKVVPPAEWYKAPAQAPKK